MALQLGALSEALRALVTLVGLLTGVSPHVVLQGRALSEALLAMATPVGHLAGVSPHVELQGACLSEALCASVALVGLLPGMCPHVDLQPGAKTKALHTLATLVGLLPGVSPHVDLQPGAQTETQHALVAPIRLLDGVGTHVDDHFGIVWKNLATQDTGPSLAGAQLTRQLLTVDQPLAAVQAFGHAVVRGHRAHSLQFGCAEEAVDRQWAVPMSTDAQDPQLPVVTGHVGGARRVHTLTL